jgi:hypothetical protein
MSSKERKKQAGKITARLPFSSSSRGEFRHDSAERELQNL